VDDMADTNETNNQTSGEPKRRIPRSLSFWVSLITFLMLFGLLLTGVIISIVRLVQMLTG
jgi:hypothetical protein